MNTEFAEPNVPGSEQAAAWFFELADGPNDRETRRRFVRWLKRSPQHIDSFLAIAVLEQELSDSPRSIEDALAAIDRPGPAAIPINGSSAGRPRTERKPGRRRPSIGWLAAAAVTALAVLGSLPFLLPPDAPPTFVHKTDFGEQRSIALSDGSIVVLNTLSEIAVRYEPEVRRVELMSGEALFDVAHDPRRPFVVETGNVALKVLGTKFSVYHTPESTRLAVVEGVVHAVSRERPEQQVLVHAGEGAVATADGAIHRKDGIDVDKAIAWTERRLIFEKVPLADVVSEFNRYNRKPIIVQDPRLAQREITSVFFANDVSALVAFLELEPDIEVDRGADAIRIHRKH
ncbi:MAG TPA: FecR domain-containing protein [Woeseiaceae bacterium]|nr:FecR domain-containing protein [Woeseiaceae bacterium]